MTSKTTENQLNIQWKTSDHNNNGLFSKVKEYFTNFISKIKQNKKKTIYIVLGLGLSYLIFQIEFEL